MDKRLKDNNLDADLKTIVEWEVDSAKDEGVDEKDDEDRFQHLELRSNQDQRSHIWPLEDSDKNPFEEQKVCSNFLGSRTYTSPVSFDSSSEKSAPNKNEYLLEANYNIGMEIQMNRKSNSIATKLKSDKFSERFSMLRNVVENIEWPIKRKILLDFLDNSTLKTQYFTLKESSSSGEEAKRLQGIKMTTKRRRKSPQSVIPKIKPHHKRRKVNGHSQERNRFSTTRPRLKTVVTPEQNIHNTEVGRKNRSDEFDSRNGDKCYTEESKEVPLEAILNKMGNYHNTYQSASRGQSGYSASKEDHRNHIEDALNKYIDVDLEANIGYGGFNKYMDKDNVILQGELIDSNKSITQSINFKAIMKWISKLKSAILMVMVLAVICLTMRTIYLEVKLHNNDDTIYSLNRSVNDLTKLNSEWKTKYDQWSVSTSWIGPSKNDKENDSNNPSIYSATSP